MTLLESLLGTYGILAIFLGTFLEGETILVLGGLAAHRGYLPLSCVVAAGFLGTFLGDQLYFRLGRRRGHAFLAKRPAWGARVAGARRSLERHDVAFILGFRFLYGLRTVSPFAIGMSEVAPGRYLVLNALGGLAWSVAIALIGYTVGEGAEALLGRAKEIELWLFLGVAAAGSIVWLVHFSRRRRAAGGRSPGGAAGDGPEPSAKRAGRSALAFPACPVEAECRARRPRPARVMPSQGPIFRPWRRGPLRGAGQEFGSSRSLPRGRRDTPLAWLLLGIPRDGGRREAMTGSGSEEAAIQRAPSVLLAEDDDDLRRLLADALRAEGYSVIECPNGLALVETLVCRLEAGERPFDLVVSDVRMPGVTGLSVLEALSGCDELRSLPMILITAFGNPHLHELAARFGAVSLLEKPFEMTALMRAVREAIDAGHAAPALRSTRGRDASCGTGSASPSSPAEAGAGRRPRA